MHDVRRKSPGSAGDAPVRLRRSCPLRGCDDDGLEAEGAPSRDPLDDPLGDADDGDVDRRVEALEQVRHAKVGAAQLDRVGVRNQSHGRRACARLA